MGCSGCGSVIRYSDSDIRIHSFFNCIEKAKINKKSDKYQSSYDVR